MKKEVYVFCPTIHPSGGPEAMHQMVFYLNEIGVDACLVYFGELENEWSIPSQYKCYVTTSIRESEFIDSSDKIIIVPEAYASSICKKYEKSSIYIWWLSVDNNFNHASVFFKFFFLLTLLPRIIIRYSKYKKHVYSTIQNVLSKRKYSFKNEKTNITHLCASYYAYDYVSGKSKNNVIKCIEPISRCFLSDFFIKDDFSFSDCRSDAILYNYRKSKKFVEKLSLYAPDLCFEPLLGLNQEQLIEKYKTSKLYIDFGAFPGAERMPKEAALFGCAVVTGKRGASGYYGDVPIPDEYKFEYPNEQIDEIVNKIRFILNHYEEVYSDFAEYRQTILSLEQSFKDSLTELFK